MVLFGQHVSGLSDAELIGVRQWRGQPRGFGTRRADAWVPAIRSSYDGGVDLIPRGYGHPDVAALVDLVQAEYRQLYGEGDASVTTPAHFSPANGEFLVGYVAGLPVAMGGWRRLAPAPWLPGRVTAEIKRMYVVPASRGRGLARQLLAALESSASAAGVDWMVLETGQPQPAAISLYRQWGYREVDGRFGRYYGDPEAVFLGKQFPQSASPAQRAQ